MRLLTLAALALSFAWPAEAQLAKPNAMGVAYGHVHLSVKDIEVHKKIWVEQFGGTVVQKGPLTAVKLPGMLIAFRAAPPTAPSQGTVMDHFGFKVKNLAEFLKGWRAAGLEVGNEFKGSEGFPNAYVMAPDGVRVELQEDTSLQVKASAYHLHFLLNDFERLRDWYVDVFGASPRMRATVLSADVPGMNLSFATSKTPTIATKGTAIDHIGFEIANLAEFVKQLEAKGIKFDIPYREVPAIELKIAYITDPSGVYIELTEGYNKY
jgi:catechol 2,3-dioxygenase-like lactoylglutathione lyase family enzyme